MALVRIPDSMRFVLITLFAWQEHPEGHVAIMGFDTKRRDFAGQEPYDYPATKENVEREIERAHLPAKSWRIVEYVDLPQDRTYRNALLDHGTHVGHDMTRARKIHLDRLRDERAVALAALDRDWMRATGQGRAEAAAAIEAERQAYRDVPNVMARVLEAAETVGDLKPHTMEAALLVARQNK